MDQAELLASTDAMVWAEEWCRIAAEIEEADDGRKLIDAGWMVGWFANAMTAAISAERRRLAEQIIGFPVTVDLNRLGEKAAGG